MWSFIKTFLACLFAMFFFFFMIAIFVSVLALIGGKEKSVETVEKDGVLHLDLNYEILEKSPESPVTFNFGQLEYNRQLGLYEILQSIRHAKTDSHIKGIYLTMGLGIDCGYATIDAIRDELINFKKSGKFVIAYGEVATQKSYYLATAADKIYLHPIGGIDLRGFGGQVTFLKGMLDKLNIETQVFYAGKFKSATEPFRLTAMSEPNKQQVRAYLQDFSTIVIQNIAKERHLEDTSVEYAINHMLVTIPEQAMERGFVDGLLFKDQVSQKISQLAKWPKDEKVNYISVGKYYKGIENESEDANIAVIVAEGDIVDGKGDEMSIGGDKYAKLIQEIKEDEEIDAVVLRINSGGGSVMASEIINRELELLSAKKTLIVSMGDVAASGGYYITTKAGKVFAQPNTITGSIGVFGIVPNLQKFFNDKLGVTFDEVELHEHAVMNLNKPLDAYEAKMTQDRIDKIYQDFITMVAKARTKNVAEIDSMAQGRVWSGVKAKELGLIDELGSLDDAIAEAAKKAGIKETKIKVYPEEKDPFTSFIEDMEENASMAIWKNFIEKEGLEEEMKYIQQVKKAKRFKGILMQMPMEIEMN